jgi:hypothetical protein
MNMVLHTIIMGKNEKFQTTAVKNTQIKGGTGSVLKFIYKKEVPKMHNNSKDKWCMVKEGSVHEEHPQGQLLHGEGEFSP